MPALGTIVFDEVRGVITPRTVPVVEDIDNPELADADINLDVGQRSRLTYRGFFATSPIAALWALVGGAAIDAEDETGETYSVKVCSLLPSSHVARCGGVAGRWIEVSVEVKPWA